MIIVPGQGRIVNLWNAVAGVLGIKRPISHSLQQLGLSPGRVGWPLTISVFLVGCCTRYSSCSAMYSITSAGDIFPAIIFTASPAKLLQREYPSAALAPKKEAVMVDLCVLDEERVRL